MFVKFVALAVMPLAFAHMRIIGSILGDETSFRRVFFEECDGVPLRAIRRQVIGATRVQGSCLKRPNGPPDEMIPICGWSEPQAVCNYFVCRVRELDRSWRFRIRYRGLDVPGSCQEDRDAVKFLPGVLLPAICCPSEE